MSLLLQLRFHLKEDASVVGMTKDVSIIRVMPSIVRKKTAKTVMM